jgi:hypothetical protein
MKTRDVRRTCDIRYKVLPWRSLLLRLVYNYPNSSAHLHLLPRPSSNPGLLFYDQQAKLLAADDLLIDMQEAGRIELDQAKQTARRLNSELISLGRA